MCVSVFLHFYKGSPNILGSTYTKINEPSQQEDGERRKKSSKAETWQEFLDSELLLAELKVIEKKI